MDKIQKFGPTWRCEDHTELSDAFQQESVDFLKAFRSVCQSSEVVLYISLDLESAIWRVPIANMELFDESTLRRATDHSLQAYRVLLEYCGPLQSQPRGFQDLAFSYMRTIRTNGPTFITKEGYISMARSKETRLGDVVCIFLRATAPFILQDGPEDRYTLICEAHMHGIMDRELMEKNPKIQIDLI